MEEPIREVNLVFRRGVPETLENDAALPAGHIFRCIDGLWDGLQFLRPFLAAFGVRQTLQLLLKVFTPSRFFYFILNDTQIVSYGWALIGRCALYYIETDACVFGPVLTVPEARGRSLAVTAARMAMVALGRKGVRRFYINARCTNHASLRMIQKMGFEGPVLSVPCRADTSG
jgi:RimJ/RimL family protein N-acetyltransferase